MARIDPRDELRALNEAISRKTSEIADLEDVVVRNSMVPSDAEREAIRRKLEEYHLVLEEYSNALGARGLSRHPRPETTEQFIQDLFQKSQNLKSEREKLIRSLERLHEKVKQAEVEKKKRTQRALADFTHAKEFIQKVRAELKRLVDALNGANKCPQICQYCGKLKKKGSELHPDPLTQLKEKIAKMLRERRSRQKKLQGEIEALEAANAAEEKRQNRMQRSTNAAQRDYEDSVRKKREAERKCREEHGKIDIIKQAIQRNVTSGRVWAKARVQANMDGFNMVGNLKLKVDGLVKKFMDLGDPLYVTTAIISAESNAGEYGFTIPKELKNYANVRRRILETMDPAEFRFFLLNDADLLKWYQIVKARYEKDAAKYEQQRAASKESLSAAKVKYDMIMKHVARAGLKPLTE